LVNKKIRPVGTISGMGIKESGGGVEFKYDLFGILKERL
jgi:hypothetical protein